MNKIIIDYGRDHSGRYWWRSKGQLGGPFATEAEARRDSEVSILGPQCKIIEAGQWDSAWERKQ